MTPELFRELVAEAALSSNVHNIQPTLWRLVDATTIAMLTHPERTLPWGDPSGRDVTTSLGAAFEGMVIAASKHGIKLSRVATETEAARLVVDGQCAPDPLAAVLTKRRTYRGRFDARRKDEGREKAQSLASRADVRLITRGNDIAAIADLADTATMRFYRDRAYRQELTSWMRLTKLDPNYARDGLNARAMEMSAPLAIAAGMVMQYPTFEILDKLQLAASLTAEAGVTKTASALVAFVQDRDADPFQTGRDWHRLWLEMTALGLAASPLTILGDDEQAATEMSQRLNLTPHQRVVTVLRAGMVDARKLPPPARLPLDEVILA